MRRRVRPTHATRATAAPIVGVQLTRLTASNAQPKKTQSMSIVRNISGPNTPLNGGSGALPGTEPGIVGDYQFEMDGIISTDVLVWRGEWAGADIGEWESVVTLLAASGNVANFNISLLPGGFATAVFIYCDVNGVEFIGGLYRLATP